LEGFFQHPPHCQDFITNVNGLELLGRLTAVPCLPYDYASGVASDSLVQVFRTMADISAQETLTFLAELTKSSLAMSRDFWVSLSPESKLLPLVDTKSDEQVQEANRYFRTLVTLQTRVTLLSDVYSAAGFAQGRAALGLLTTLMQSNIVGDLGSLHKACIWENITLKAGLSAKGLPAEASVTTPAATPTQESTPVFDGPIDGAVANGNIAPAVDGSSAESKDASSKPGPRADNAKALKHITHGLTNTLSPFFQGAC
jgi:E3 ubiquitin-protein ligase HUWE1